MRRTFRRLLVNNLVPLLAGGIVAGQAVTATGQTAQWQPTRVSPQSQAQPMSAAAATNRVARMPSSQVAGSQEQLGQAVVLRWKRSGSAQPLTTQAASLNRAQAFNSYPAPRSNSPSATNQPRRVAHAQATLSRGLGNPLRGVVQAAAVQQDGFGVEPIPASPGGLPQLPNGIFAPIPQQGAAEVDPLGLPDLAPAPGGLEPAGMQPLAPMGEDTNAPNPFPRDQPQPVDENQFGSPEPVSPSDDFMDDVVPRYSAASCNELREQINSRPLSDISLNPSPVLGGALRMGAEDIEQARNRLATASGDRDWTDYLGRHVAHGRIVDMKNNKVFINCDGTIETVAYLDLSDRDVEYVGEVWNIPGRCGTGYEPFEGRQFIPTQFQWTASGLCHKPSYFANPQLERYGHEIGPVLQPLVSTAAFVGNIALLPYKMGIHPPNECQYSLGYYRPGNCAPYMVQPFPLSLRGAAAQAVAVTGLGALVP